MGPRFGGQPRPGLPLDQQGGQHQYPGQLGSPRQNQVPDQQLGQSGSPRQGHVGDQQPRSQIGAPRVAPSVDQVRAPMSSPRLGSPRNQMGSPHQGPFPDQGRGRPDASADHTGVQMGPASQDPRVDQGKAPYGIQQQGRPLDQPRGQFGPSQQSPVMDQGSPRVSSADKGLLLDQSGRQPILDTRNGYSQHTRGTSTHSSSEHNSPGTQQRADGKNGQMPDASMMNGRMGPSFSSRQESPEQRPGDSDQHVLMGQSRRPLDRPGFQGGQPRSYNEDNDGRRSPPRRMSFEEAQDKVGDSQILI